LFGGGTAAADSEPELPADPALAASSVRGVPVRDEPRYTGLRFTCDGGSRELSVAAVNDDYCDCDDGSDEPGTAACSGRAGTTFFCANEQSVGRSIPASQVNDGICDCCDGSDESAASCSNRCVEEGKAIRAALAKENSERAAGLAKKQEYIAAAAASSSSSNEEAELEKILADIQQVDAEIESLNAQTERLSAALVEETKSREAQLRARRAEALQLALLDRHDLENLLIDLAVDTSSSAALERLVIEAFAARAASRESVQVSADGSISSAEVPQPRWISTSDEMSSEESSEDDYDEAYQEHPDEAADEGATEVSLTVSQQLDKVKKDQQAAKDRLRKLNKRKTEVESELSLDFGPDNVWWSLRDSCFELAADGYTYKMCPFDKSRQNSVELGKWAGFKEGSDYKVLLFENGQKCWNGPKRSLTVTARCGSDNQLLHVEEPSMCEYTAEFITPAAC